MCINSINFLNFDIFGRTASETNFNKGKIIVKLSKSKKIITTILTGVSISVQSHAMTCNAINPVTGAEAFQVQIESWGVAEKTGFQKYKQGAVVYIHGPYLER